MNHTIQQQSNLGATAGLSSSERHAPLRTAANKSDRASSGTRFPFLAFVVCLTAITGCDRFAAPGKAAPDNNPPTTKKQFPVITVESREVRETLDLPATIVGYEQARLMAKIDGYVKQVHVNIGDEVAAGDVLVTLDSPEMGQQVQQQEKLLAEARADIELAAAEWEASKAKLAEQQAMIDLRKSEFARVASLVASGALNDQKQEEARFALQSAEASMSQTVSAVQVAEARQKKAAAHADVVEAQWQQARTMAGYQEIRAPFAGVVTKRSVDPGDFVQPGAGSMPLVELDVIDKLRAIIQVTMNDVGKVATGNRVTLSLVDVPGKMLEGTVSRASGVFDKDSRMMRAEIDIDNLPDPETGRRALRAGSYGTATVEVQVATLPAVPKEAIHQAGDKKTVTIVSSDGTCLTSIVEIGVDGGNLLGIASGLAAGDRVVASDPNSVKHRQKLSADEIKPKPY